MKIGFGTVLWGRRIDDLDYMLRVIKACGYKGVEFAQHHHQIFVRHAMKTAEVFARSKE